MSFYTSVVDLGNAIGHRYIRDGVRHKEVIKKLDLELFLPSVHTHDSIDPYNNTLKKYSFSNLTDFKKFISDHGRQNIYGNTDAVSQFIAKHYPYKEDIVLDNQYVYLNFDIEIEHGTGFEKYKKWHNVNIKYDSGETQSLTLIELKTVTKHFLIYDEEKNEYVEFDNSCYTPKDLGFPDVNLAKCPLLSVSLISNQEKIINVIGYKEYDGPDVLEGTEYKLNYIYCENERELLVRFIQLWRQINPDIITGWNIEKFDTPYLINRIVRVLGYEYANMLSPYSIYKKNCVVEKFIDDRVIYNILGISSYDYIDIYKKFSQDKQESYKLDWIGFVELSMNKISYEEFDNSLMKLYEYGFKKFIQYNGRDTQIVDKLDEKLDFISLAITIAHLTRSDLSDALGSVKIWDNLIYNILLELGIQIIPSKTLEKETLLGAFVKIPLLGRHGRMITFDLTSLYPMIIIMLGMSPEALYYREVGNNPAANKEILKSISENIEYIGDALSKAKYSNQPVNKAIYADLVSSTEFYKKSHVNKLYSLSKETLIELLKEMQNLHEYYSSGHDYIHGVKDKLETIDAMVEGSLDLSFAKELNVTVAGNGSMYRKDVLGVIPRAMSSLFELRKSLKGLKKSYDRQLQSKIEELHKLENQIS